MKAFMYYAHSIAFCSCADCLKGKKLLNDILVKHSTVVKDATYLCSWAKKWL